MSRNMTAPRALSFINQQQQARLAQSVARETLNLKVVGSSPTSGFKQFFFAHDCLMVVGVERVERNFGSECGPCATHNCARRCSADGVSVFLFDFMPEP
jgi:hypothetical protein